MRSAAPFNYFMLPNPLQPFFAGNKCKFRHLVAGKYSEICHSVMWKKREIRQSATEKISKIFSHSRKKSLNSSTDYMKKTTQASLVSRGKNPKIRQLFTRKNNEMSLSARKENTQNLSIDRMKKKKNHEFCQSVVSKKNPARFANWQK